MEKHIYETRLKNLRNLAIQKGGRSALAHEANVSYNLLTQYIGKNPYINIGEEFARKIESSLKLQFGWLDHDQEKLSKMQELAPLDSLEAIPCLSLELNPPIQGELKSSKEKPMLYLLESDKKKLSEGGINLENLKAYPIEDETMEPLLHKGCRVLIDTGNKEPKDGKRYAFRIKDNIVIRRLYVYPDSYKITCDTEDLKVKKANRDIDLQNLGGDIEIIGRIAGSFSHTLLDD